jgi:hypothetical protein
MNRMTKLVLAFVVGASLSASAAEVDRREQRQQQRIAQGVKSGQLTSGETARLEKKEAAIHEEVKQERAANGGRLTPAERRQVNRQENRLNRQIYRAKHNDRHE